MFPEDIYDMLGFPGEPGAEIFFLFFLAIYGISGLIGIASYVLQALSLYTIAQRRRIRHPWLAWIPVGSSWLIGCVSDQYRYVTRGQEKNKRKALLILQIVLTVIVIALCAVAISMISQLISYGEEMTDGQLMQFLGNLGGVMMLYFAMLGVSIAVTVITYMALYDLYSSCDPKNAVIYLVLGILFPIAQMIFLFICRKKDLGMPPRKTECYAEIPAQPQWQPPQPQREPWDQDPE